MHRSGVVTDSLSYLLLRDWIVLTVSFTEPKPLPTTLTNTNNNNNNSEYFILTQLRGTVGV